MDSITHEQVFDLHPSIRWAGMVTDQGEVIFVKMRPGVTSLSPKDTDQSFMQLGPMLLSGVCERLAPWAGSLESVISKYQKVIMITTRLPGRYLSVTMAERDADKLQNVLEALQTLKFR